MGSTLRIDFPLFTVSFRSTTTTGMSFEGFSDFFLCIACDVVVLIVIILGSKVP